MQRVEPNGLFTLDLNDDERHLLRRGTWEWGGPAYATETLAIAMGFTDFDDFMQALPRLRAALDLGEPMSAIDWVRLVLATEIAFVSDFIGSGTDWSTTTGRSDQESIAVLRGLQRKIRGSGALNDAINSWLVPRRA
jgi:hypothetical protein